MAGHKTSSFLGSILGSILGSPSVGHIEKTYLKNEAARQSKRTDAKKLLEISLEQLQELESFTFPEEGDKTVRLYTETYFGLLQVKNKFPCFASEAIDSAARLALAAGDSARSAFLMKFLTKDARRRIETDADAEKKSAEDAVAEQKASEIDEEHSDVDGSDSSFDDFYSPIRRRHSSFGNFDGVDFPIHRNSNFDGFDSDVDGSDGFDDL